MKYTLRFLMIAAVALMSFSASAITHTITQQGLSFAPEQLTVEVGDVILFQWTSGNHTTTSSSVPAGADTWDALLTSGMQTFEYTVTTEGAYEYVCTPHASAGMVGEFTAVLSSNTRTQVAANLSVNAGTSANGQLFVELNNATTDMATVTLVDITGRNVATLHHGAIADADFTIRHDIAAIQRGIYFVRFQEGARVVTRKVLVQ
jgi:plastocyanin